MSLFQKQTERYWQRKKEFGVSPQGAGWKSKEAQEIRFEQLVKVLNKSSNFSLNDIGCGYAHLLDYLQARGFQDFFYRGYDIAQEMIAEARHRCQASNSVSLEPIADIKEVDIADYSIASGIFSFKGEACEAKWLAYILEAIDTINKKSTLGFSFNMLTKYSDPEFMEDELYYADPCFIFDFCKRNFARNVALLHDYQEYDFTIIVRR